MTLALNSKKFSAKFSKVYGKVFSGEIDVFISLYQTVIYNVLLLRLFCTFSRRLDCYALLGRFCFVEIDF